MELTLSEAYSFTQKGKRNYQEDARYPDHDLINAGQRFFMICDGVGGCDYGEMASNIVCKAFGKKMESFNLKKDFSNNSFSAVLNYAYSQLDKAGEKIDGELATTMTFVCFHGEGCTMAHIGDSRIYQIRPECGIIYKSDDHSLVNNLVHNGLISPDEAKRHPKRNVIMRSMGPIEEDEEHSKATVVRTTDLKTNDYFLLCSDGVYSCLDDDEITNLLCDSSTDNQSKLKWLSELCVNSDDNNTAILVQIKNVDNQMQEEPENTEIKENTVRITNQLSKTSEIEANQNNTQSSLIQRIKKIFK